MSTSRDETNNSSPEEQHSANIASAYTSFKHNAAIFLIVGAPLLIALPPRKLDLYTFSLAGAWVASANQLTKERTGRGLIQQFGYKYQQKELSQTSPVAGTSSLKSVPGYSNIEDSKAAILKEQTASDWKEKRLREEQEKLNQGEGYGGMIADQIWDVWNQKKDEDTVPKTSNEKK